MLPATLPFLLGSPAPLGVPGGGLFTIGVDVRRGAITETRTVGIGADSRRA